MRQGRRRWGYSTQARLACSARVLEGPRDRGRAAPPGLLGCARSAQRMTMSPIRNVDLLKVALLFAAVFAALLTLHTGARRPGGCRSPCG